MRSAKVAPIPIRMPVVKGTRARPACSSVASRAAGLLAGALKWPTPLAGYGSGVVSILSPWLTLTSLRASTSGRVKVPGLA